MRFLYSDADLSILRAQVRRRQLLALAVALVFLAGILFTLIQDDHKDHRPEVWTTLMVILGGCAIIFLWDLTIRPLRSQARHMDAALHGRSHELLAVFNRFGSEDSLIDGLRYRDLIFLGEADKHGDRERLFYWDLELPLPDFQPGQQFRLTYFDRFLIGYEAV